jgi:hypothetical protein
MFQITVDENTPPRLLRAAVALLELLEQQPNPHIAVEDRPDTGSPVSPLPQLGTAVVPLPFPPVPSSAVAEAPLTAHVATMGFSAPSAPVASLPAPQFAPMVVAPPAPTQAPAPAGVDLDKDGFPWDSRIHAGGAKGKNADGSWRQKRGVDAALVTKVQAELRQLMSLPAPESAPFTAAQRAEIPLAPSLANPGPGAPSWLTEIPLAPAYSDIPPPLPPAPPMPPALASAVQDSPSLQELFANVPPTGLGDAPLTYEDFLSRVTPLTTTGQLQLGSLVAACQAVGIPSLQLLASRPDLIPQLWAKLA